MKYLNMCGLNVIAALGLMACLAAGSASATALCKEATDPCPEGQRWKTGTEIFGTMTAGTSTRETEGESVYNTCTESRLGWVQENEGSATETVTMDMGVSKASCTNNGLGNFFPTKFEIHQIPGTSDGTFTGLGEMELGICGTYIATQVGTLTGGNEPTLDMEVVLKRIKGFLCSARVGWDATYTITSLTPIFVTEG
jgi:hypothetical protein